MITIDITVARTGRRILMDAKLIDSSEYEIN